MYKAIAWLVVDVLLLLVGLFDLLGPGPLWTQVVGGFVTAFFAGASYFDLRLVRLYLRLYKLCKQFGLTMPIK